MTKIHPFRAIRPVRDKVHLVATRPYYSYKKNVLQAKIQDNPFTLLHIINPEIGKTKSTLSNSNERFKLVTKRYQEFLEKETLIQESLPKLYVYRQTTPTNTFSGIIAGADVQEYLDDKIKKHEETLTDRENMFTQYLDVVGYNAEPVLIAYQDNTDIDALLNETFISNRPEYEFSTTDLIKHELWIVPNHLHQPFIDAFENLHAVYIADGHHRSASSVSLYKKRTSTHQPLGSSASFLAYFVKESALNIMEFQRLVRNQKDFDLEKFLYSLGKLGTITSLPSSRKPLKNHEITFYASGRWFAFEWNAIEIDTDHPTLSLDAEMLTVKVLGLFNIRDLKTSQDVEFFPGNIPLSTLEKEIDQNHFQIGFFLYPVNFSQVRKVADAGMFMPPKSTFIEPKLRSGLTILDINDPQ